MQESVLVRARVCGALLFYSQALLGVGFHAEAQSLHQCPFRGPTAFMLGNERGGSRWKHWSGLSQN